MVAAKTCLSELRKIHEDRKIQSYVPGAFLRRGAIPVNRQRAETGNDSRALRSWHEWELKNGERSTILCVETDLEMRSGEPGFDAEQLSLLIQEAMEMMRASPSPIDAVRIVPER